MQTLILPGYSDSNKDWVDSVAKSLTVGDIIRPFYWAHWTDPVKVFDPREKAELIARHTKGENVNIVAKSLGTLVAAYVIELIPDQIEKIIFCGIPLKDLKPEEIEKIKEVIAKNNSKFVGFQNSSDPHGQFNDVKDFGNMVVKEASDHNYYYFEEFNSFLVR